ncbi:hypothetical protein QR680_000267 [Steinernema hermaphroditum]|uniref:Uncharacterized protein n=1 Tax=Steinernema hermaphroditum TaxID=289476 RepID=A0AA39GUW9_9BILA|nr:hypothetical protein QR680_000267 [Steinernema hermaphroditum]
MKSTLMSRSLQIQPCLTEAKIDEVPLRHRPRSTVTASDKCCYPHVSPWVTHIMCPKVHQRLYRFFLLYSFANRPTTQRRKDHSWNGSTMSWECTVEGCFRMDWTTCPTTSPTTLVAQSLWMHKGYRNQTWRRKCHFVITQGHKQQQRTTLLHRLRQVAEKEQPFIEWFDYELGMHDGSISATSLFFLTLLPGLPLSVPDREKHSVHPRWPTVRKNSRTERQQIVDLLEENFT